MCFSERTCRWSSTCLLSSLLFSELKVFRRERTTSPRRTIYCPSLGIPHDPGMGTESGKGMSGELTLAALSWLSDKTESAAPESLTRSTLAPSHVLTADEKTSTNSVISKANKTAKSRDVCCSPFFNAQIKRPSSELENKVAALLVHKCLISVEECG